MALKYMQVSPHDRVNVSGPEPTDDEIRETIRNQCKEFFGLYFKDKDSANWSEVRPRMEKFCLNYKWKGLPFGGWDVKPFVDAIINDVPLEPEKQETPKPKTAKKHTEESGPTFESVSKIGPSKSLVDELARED